MNIVIKQEIVNIYMTTTNSTVLELTEYHENRKECV